MREPAALATLEVFETGPWAKRYPTVAPAWRRAWAHVIPFFAFPPADRRVIYTTNVIENLHSQKKRSIKSRGHFPSNEAAIKVPSLVLHKATAGCVRATRDG